MKKIINQYKKILAVITLILVFTIGNTYVLSAPAATAIKTTNQTKQNEATEIITGLSVDPVKVVNNPKLYLNKSITFETDFIAFSSLGLDYKPALREAEKYIGLLIQRTDVKDHIIPLSEMKLFLLRKDAEKHIDLEQGDKIKITGTVFSTALGDPWVDIKSLTVISKKNKDNKENK